MILRDPAKRAFSFVGTVEEPLPFLQPVLPDRKMVALTIDLEMVRLVTSTIELEGPIRNREQ